MTRILPYLRAAGGHRASLGLVVVAAVIVAGGIAGILDTADWIWLPGIGAVLSLVAACIAHPGLAGRPWLFAAHLLMAGLVVLALGDRATAFRGTLEIAEGAAFSPDLMEFEAGPLHPFGLDRIRFRQGGFAIRYAPGMKRRETVSTILIEDGHGSARQQAVGDETPLRLAGYRFYTTFNKGFAPVLTHTDAQGRRVTGSVHMPPYPLFSHRQENRWTPPGGPELGLWLAIGEPVFDEDADWTFRAPAAPELIVAVGDARHRLRPGDEISLPSGRLRFEELRSWMGYTVTANPLLPWLAALAAATGLCLALHVAGTGRRTASRVAAGEAIHVA